MKNMQLDDEEARWKRLCLQELSGIKKLKRRRPEPAKPQLGACRTFPGDLKVRPPVLGGGLGGEGGSRAESKTAASKGAAAATAAPAELVESRGGGGSNEVLDMRKPAFPAGLFTSLQQPLRKDTCLRPVSVNGAEGQALSGQSLPSRVMACQQQRRRPLESPPYSPVSPAIYGSHPDSSLSPRKRPGELAGASSEIKALQQTRRLLANARERTRVHTISAAFEALRKQVPCYSYGQKLSKLAILRIACNYILSLARLANLDYSADHSNMSFSECVEHCTRTLQAEGRSKKRKE